MSLSLLVIYTEVII